MQRAGAGVGERKVPLAQSFEQDRHSATEAKQSERFRGGYRPGLLASDVPVLFECGTKAGEPRLASRRGHFWILQGEGEGDLLLRRARFPTLLAEDRRGHSVRLAFHQMARQLFQGEV